MNYKNIPINVKADSKEEKVSKEVKKNSPDNNCLHINKLDITGQNSILNQKVKDNSISFDFLNSNFLLKETKNPSNRMSMLNHSST